MEKICGIYCIENLINNKKYIGLSKDCLKRWADHRSKSIHPTKDDEIRKPLYMAIRKYGLENFSFTILEECPYEKLKEREIYWIDFYNSYDEGYNATRGGDLPEGHILKGEEHGLAKLTEEEVIQCRIWYSEGKRSRDIYENQFNFKERIAYRGFQKMWHGTTWKHIMPEVFENNLNPRKKITDEDVLKIKELWYSGVTVKEITEMYKDKCSHTTISDIVNKKRYAEIEPVVEDKHVSRRKLTDDDIRLIKKLKSEGYLHREIREKLNNKVGMTIISDIVNGKRYSEIN